MPMHDWTRVEAEIYYAIHHEWISEIKRALNGGLLPDDHYALAEQDAAGFGLGKSSIAVRHVSGDRIVAMIEIVSPVNKNNKNAFHALIEKACELLEHRIHFLLIDPFPPSRRDPNGIHAAIWEHVDDDPFNLPPERPLTLVAYECSLITQAYIETMAVGEMLPEMPLFLAPDAHLLVPLEATYQSAWDALPARWQRVVAATPSLSP